VEAGSVGSPVVEADALGEIETVNELAEPVEDDDAVVDGPVETAELVAVVVEDTLAADVLEIVVVEVVEDDVDLVVEDVDVEEDVEEDVVEDDVDFVEDVVVEEEEVDEVELVVEVDVELVDVDCAAIVKYADSVMFWVSVTICAWLLLPPLQSSKT
jgi:hypothetical protein